MSVELQEVCLAVINELRRHVLSSLRVYSELLWTLGPSAVEAGLLTVHVHSVPSDKEHVFIRGLCSHRHPGLSLHTRAGHGCRGGEIWSCSSAEDRSGLCQRVCSAAGQPGPGGHGEELQHRPRADGSAQHWTEVRSTCRIKLYEDVEKLQESTGLCLPVLPQTPECSCEDQHCSAAPPAGGSDGSRWSSDSRTRFHLPLPPGSQQDVSGCCSCSQVRQKPL